MLHILCSEGVFTPSRKGGDSRKSSEIFYVACTLELFRKRCSCVVAEVAADMNAKNNKEL
jgi:hypothetical protein